MLVTTAISLPQFSTKLLEKGPSRGCAGGCSGAKGLSIKIEIKQQLDWL